MRFIGYCDHKLSYHTNTRRMHRAVNSISVQYKCYSKWNTDDYVFSCTFIMHHKYNSIKSIQKFNTTGFRSSSLKLQYETPQVFATSAHSTVTAQAVLTDARIVILVGFFMTRDTWISRTTQLWNEQHVDACFASVHKVQRAILYKICSLFCNYLS